MADVTEGPPVNPPGSAVLDRVGGSASPGRPSPRWTAVLALLVCLAGLGFSVELTRIHVRVFTEPDFVPICAVSEGVNCATVALSPWSVFAGLPVSAWGIGGYLLLSALALWAALPRRPHPTWPWGLLSLAAGFSLCVSIALATLSALRIDSLCLYCMATYGLNALLSVLCILTAWRARTGPVRLVARDLSALVAHPWPSGAAGVAGAGAVVAALLLVPRYWQVPGWADLPALPSGDDERGHHWIGAEDPDVTIVEFSDYECPHCRRAHKTVRTLAAAYPDRVRLVHRHLPLDRSCHPKMRRRFHAHACRFAEAAECAALQGRFWAMNDALFSSQDTRKASAVDPVALAVRIGLDRSTFKACLDAHTTAGRVAADLADAVGLDLHATPTFLVDGQVYRGRLPDNFLQGRLGSPSR